MPESKDQDKPDSGVKRRSTSTESPDHKRQKRGPRAKKAAKKSESPIEELSEEEKPKPRKRKAPAPPKTKAKVVESESESSLTELEDEESLEPVKESASDNDEVSAINAVVDLKSGEEESGKDDEKDEEKKTENKETPSAPVDEEEEYSDVIDEPVKPKRKKRETKEKKATTTKSAKASKASKAASKPTSTSDDPNEAEIKRLQSYLIKCGIRKLWHNELKKYGDDSRAKIKHLKKMLADVGMDGRFSEAKAREIKDRRELLAELESAQEMNELWGKDTNGRASRSKNKNVKEDSGQSGGEGDEEEEEEEQQAFAARRRRAQADFAFLGDDSDSD